MPQLSSITLCVSQRSIFSRAVSTFIVLRPLCVCAYCLCCSLCMTFLRMAAQLTGHWQESSSGGECTRRCHSCHHRSHWQAQLHTESSRPNPPSQQVTKSAQQNHQQVQILRGKDTHQRVSYEAKTLTSEWVTRQRHSPASGLRGRAKTRNGKVACPIECTALATSAMLLLWCSNGSI